MGAESGFKHGGQPLTGMHQHLAAALVALEQAGLKRALKTLATAQGPEVESDGSRLLNFSSNDYLGLATEPVLANAAIEAIARHGTGAGASRLISGTLSQHTSLEAELARWKGTNSALTFSSGYATAVGTLGALAGPEDVIILDKLCHACIIDGARLSGAVLRVYPHNSLERLESHLRWARLKHPRGKIIIATESVFSMDGDCAPLREIVALKEKYGAWLLLDEAHAAGVFGASGAGLAEAEGLTERIDIHMGTLSKAMGCAGGYICGADVLVEWLANKARSFMFSTAPPPALAATGEAAVRWMASPDGAHRRSLLWRNIGHFQKCTNIAHPPESAIVPIQVGSNEAAMAASRKLQTTAFEEKHGFWVPAIRYPTVPRGTARLRVTLSALHTLEAIEALGQALQTLDLCERT